MTYMKFKKEADGIYVATNCPVELDIVEFTHCKPGDSAWKTYVVATARTQDEFDTFDKAVRFAEYKFGVRFETKETA